MTFLKRSIRYNKHFLLLERSFYIIICRNVLMFVDFISWKPWQGLEPKGSDQYYCRVLQRMASPDYGAPVSVLLEKLNPPLPPIICFFTLITLLSQICAGGSRLPSEISFHEMEETQKCLLREVKKLFCEIPCFAMRNSHFQEAKRKLKLCTYTK